MGLTDDDEDAAANLPTHREVVKGSPSYKLGVSPSHEVEVSPSEEGSAVSPYAYQEVSSIPQDPLTITIDPVDDRTCDDPAVSCSTIQTNADAMQFRKYEQLVKKYNRNKGIDECNALMLLTHNYTHILRSIDC